MIKLTYNDGCRLGNRLYMYAAGRLLAKKLGLALYSDSLEGFPKTNEPVDGEFIEGPVEKVNGADPIPSWPDVECLKGRRIEIEHGFINSRYFMGDRDLIKSWLSGPPLMRVEPDDVLVSVRLREFVQLGIALHPYYYTSVLERMAFKKLYLMTDDPENPYLDCLSKYNPEVIPGYGPEHFFKALAFRRVVMSNSTFCWWHVFLSDAWEVYLPMLNGYRCGSWCLDHLPAIDLRLDLPGVTHVYNVPNAGPFPMCLGPTDEQRVEAMAYGKHSKAFFLEPM